MATISNTINTSTNVSTFGYTYNPVGTIATWSQQADSGATAINTLTYDAADQLTNSTNTLSGTNIASNDYAYDPAGNRLAETTLSGTTGGQFNNLNQLTGYSATTTNQTVAGYTSAAVSSVTINAVPAMISTNGTNFSASVPLPNGTNILSVVAQPSGSNTPIFTQKVKIVTSATTPTPLTYDANGNTLTDEKGNTYTWDALNRLTAIVYGSGSPSYGTHTEMAYDGLSRRVQIVERDGATIGSGTVISTKNYLWIGSEIAEERDSSNTVTKRFFPQGEQQSGTPYYYTTDHEESVREVVDGSGTIQARYSYDPSGVTTLVQGSNIATFQYAGMQMHQTSGLYLTQAGDGRSTGRPYDTLTARFPSRDPIAEAGGINLYEYAGNDPVENIDPSGEAAIPFPKTPAQAAAAALVITAAYIACEINPKCAQALRQLEKAAAEAALQAIAPKPKPMPLTIAPYCTLTRQDCEDKFDKCIMSANPRNCLDCLLHCRRTGRWPSEKCPGY